MKQLTLLLLLFTFFWVKGQEQATDSIASEWWLTPEVMVGKTLPANSGFPETNAQKNIFLTASWNSAYKNQEWAYRLGYPKTGFSVGAIDFGNDALVGQAFTAMPVAEFHLFKKRSDRWHVSVGMGGSYFNTQFDSITNPNNKAVTTKLTWSFKSFLYHKIATSGSVDWRLGAGYIHHSNGHTRLPNQGLNSLAISASAQFSMRKSSLPNTTVDYQKSKYWYFSSRFGYGENILSVQFNDKKPVYTAAFGLGKVLNNTFRIGVGLYYRYYQHYRDYIDQNEFFVETEYPHFRENPFGYATNVGVFGTGELLLNHVGMEFQLGLNIYKPFYKIDWQLNQGPSYVSQTNEGSQYILVPGELDWYYEVKRTISSRMGIKYYIWGTHEFRKHNVFLGAHINANLGQADFTEFSIGYVYSFTKS